MSYVTGNYSSHYAILGGHAKLLLDLSFLGSKRGMKDVEFRIISGLPMNSYSFSRSNIDHLLLQWLPIIQGENGQKLDPNLKTPVELLTFQILLSSFST